MVEINKKIKNFKANALVNGEEKQIQLDDFKGKKIALYFYPKDLTSGCTIQAQNLRDNLNLLEKNNIIVIGVSKDSIKSHLKFKDKEDLNFILISDEDLKLNEMFDVWVEKSMYGRKYMGTNRTTFLINEEGILVKIIDKPTVSDHAQEVLNGFN